MEINGPVLVATSGLLEFYRWGNRIGSDMRSRYRAWTHHALGALARPAVERAFNRDAASAWE